MSVHPAISRALAAFDDEEIPALPPSSLPLLQKFRAAHSDRKSFSGLDALFIQHHLGPFIPRLGEMVDAGLRPERCWFVDIPYSTNKLVKNELARRGYASSRATACFDNPLASYAEAQASRVSFLLLRIARRRDPQPLLVVDDGAYFARFLKGALEHDPDLLEGFRGTRVVEQTTRGHRFLLDEADPVIRACDLHVVSIARCRTKVEFEGPFIGAAVSRAIARAVSDSLGRTRHIGVIGYGTVGRAVVAELLRRNSRAFIDVVDIDPRARDEASNASKRCQGRTSLRTDVRYELILGCTGYNSFKLADREILADGALLASGSSAAVEFNRAGFVELADRYPDDELEVLDREATITRGIHANITISQARGRRFTFLNAGFPVNFDGRLECLPTRVIQATHCLLYAAAEQTRESSLGVQPIAEELDEWILHGALAHLQRGD